jgi:hypothetical protein
MQLFIQSRVFHDDDASVSSGLPAGNKRQRVAHCLSQNRGEGSSFQVFNFI